MADRSAHAVGPSASPTSASSTGTRATSSLINEMLTFIEAAVHSILYCRGIYPSNLFERRRKYGMAVWMSRHPQLNTYITKVLRNAQPLFERGLVLRVLVPITGKDGVVRETYTFAFSNYAAGPTLDLRQLQDAFRGCLSRLNVVESQLKPLPPPATTGSCTFKIVIVTESDGKPFDEVNAAADSNYGTTTDRVGTLFVDDLLL